jgi:hypothetical protein
MEHIKLSPPDTTDDYSDFSLHLGYVMGVLGLFAAFTFTLICLIIAEISDPSIFQIQAILLFLSILFYLSLILLADTLAMDNYYCGKLPPLVGSYKIFEYALFILFDMFGLVVPLIFISWSLWLLAEITTIIFTISSILAIKFILIPLLKVRKSQSKG